MRLTGYEQGKTTPEFAGAMQDNVDFDIVLREFYSEVWSLINSASKIPHDGELPERELRRLFNDYFARAQAWLERQERRHVDTPSDATARRLKREAREIFKDFERGMFRYTLCYMNLNRHLIQFKSHMEYHRKKHTEEGRDTSIQINDTTALLIKRACREKKALLERRAKVAKSRASLEQLDKAFQALYAGFQSCFGRQRAEHTITLFRGSLRHGRFADARAMMREWQNAKDCHAFTQAAQAAGLEAASEILKILERDKDLLAVQDGYLLEPADTNMVYSFLLADEARVDSFLQKYSYSSLSYKFRTLLKQAYKLGRMGKFETLLGLHVGLIIGIANPLETSPQLQNFEREILSRVSLLVQERFPDIPNIFDETDVEVAHLKDMLEAMRELEELAASIPAF